MTTTLNLNFAANPCRSTGTGDEGVRLRLKTFYHLRVKVVQEDNSY